MDHRIATAEIEDLARMRRSVKLPSVKFRDFTLMTRLLRGGSSRGRPVFRWLSLLLLRPLRPPSLALNREHLAVCLELRLQDRLREQQRPPHARARAHIHKLVLMVEDACRGIDTNGSLAAAWRAMEKVDVKQITSEDLAV